MVPMAFDRAAQMTFIILHQTALMKFSFARAFWLILLEILTGGPGFPERLTPN
jgi:hypothetical protein